MPDKKSAQRRFMIGGKRFALELSSEQFDWSEILRGNKGFRGNAERVRKSISWPT